MSVLISVTRCRGSIEIIFRCEKCDERVTADFMSLGPWSPEFEEVAIKSAIKTHDDECPPRRSVYRRALDVPLRIKPRT